jgi:hypothetical protein
MEDAREKGVEPVKASMYRTIFNTRFNLRFKKPHTDTCTTCDTLENQIKYGETEDVIAEKKKEQEEHLLQQEKAKDAKKRAMHFAKAMGKTVRAVCFDLEKTLPTPLLTCSKVFYLRQLWTYNFAVHDLVTNDASMFMWHESDGSRGSAEVSSCLLRYIHDLPTTVRHLIAFSDNAGGQNKNVHVVKFWAYVVNSTHLETVDHKFLVSGHSYMECDRDFGLIEVLRKKSTNLFVPDDWMTLVTKASRKFSVFRMSNTSFKSIAPLNKVLPVKSIPGIRKMQWLHFTKDEPTTLFYKMSMEDDAPFLTKSLRIATVGRPPVFPIELPCLYSGPLPIRKTKYDNLIQLLPYIPPIHHSFYTTLAHTTARKRQSQVLQDEVDNMDDSILTDTDLSD